MSIVVVCECGKRLRAADIHAGKRVRCPHCGRTLRVPEFPGPSVRTKPLPLYDPRGFEILYNWFRGLIIPGTIGSAVLALLPGAFLVSRIIYGADLLLASVFYFTLLYRAWKQIQDGHARTTPGKAVGFLFIPFFNVYWTFVAVRGLAQDVNRYATERVVAAPPISEGLARTYCILWLVDVLLCWVPLVGLVIEVAQNVVLLFLLHQVKDAAMAIATAKLIRRATP